jgi:hypothetical protein
VIAKARRFSAITLLLFAMLMVTILTGLAILAPFVVWQLMPYRQLSVWVLDKTVPYPDFREHLGFFWIMKNEKISKPGSKILYDERSDYYGFFPYGKAEWAKKPLPSSGIKPDMIYLTDTYGVYRDDFMQSRLSGEISPIIYGGLTAEDNNSIQRALGSGNTLIAEFNVAASPTNAADRKVLGRLLGIKWTGWIANYFEDLTKGNAVPNWVVSNYESQRGMPWKFTGRGFVLIADDDTIEVLDSSDMGPGWMKIRFNEKYSKILDIPRPVSYRYWFEWTTSDTGVETIANYTLDVTSSGKKKLDSHGLPSIIPAVMRFPNPQYMGWYFAGDFADLKLADTPYYIAGIRWIKKVLVDDTVDSNSYFYWKAYVPLINYILGQVEAAKKKALTIPSNIIEPKVDVRAFGSGFQMRDKDGVWRDFFVHGVNLGTAEPGKYFTDFPEKVSTYRRWLDGMANMNANTVRLYTLPPPEFYRALYAHNVENPDKALYLLQEIWPEENPPNGDYLAKEYRDGFLKEIDYGIDAVYGRANIPERKGRAWGIYTADVSKWLLGWLVGRELESSEVMSTDQRNAGAKFSGKYVSTGAEASPTEAWLAESLDEVANIEADRYGVLHPVAVVSWPTLDSINHDSEWDPKTGKQNKANDRASISLDHFDITPKMTAGLFGAYHIYPNYPDFMNNEASYGNYTDDQGVLRYGGYLKEFRATVTKYPIMVAEFGMANGSGVAHFAPDGLNHGGMDETTAGKDILRMLSAIKREGYAGGLIFEWMDEWVKKTWTTETLMIPFDRHVLWHNVEDPEQNYGLMANDVVPPDKPAMVLPGSGNIKSVGLSADAAYFHIDIEFTGTPNFAQHEILVGLDTYERAFGQFRWPVGNLSTKSGLEFLVRIKSPDDAQLLVIHPYNEWEFRYQTMKLWDGVFEPMMPVINGAVHTKDGRFIPEKKFDASILRKGVFDEAGNLWTIEGNHILLRLPWILLNVTDPSSLKILQDTRIGFYSSDHDQLKTMPSDGFVVDALAWNDSTRSVEGSIESNISKPFYWDGWESTPPYVERFKKSYQIIMKDWEQYSKADSYFKGNTAK